VRLICKLDQDLFKRNGKRSNANASCIEDCVRNRCARAADAEFADTFAADRIRIVIRNIEHDDLDLQNIGVRRKMISGEIVVDETSL
jgi:hypothetical protein